MKHTDGPWSFEYWVDMQSKSDFVFAQNGKIICQFFNQMDEEFPNKEASARLISAAPELLEALKNALRNEGQDPCFKDNLGWEMCHCWRCQARGVIAKAETAV